MITVVEEMWGVSVPDAARALGVSDQTVRRMFDRKDHNPDTGWLEGEWKVNPTLGRRERRIHPDSLEAEQRRRAELRRRAVLPPRSPDA